jgi:hypothetical protein
MTGATQPLEPMAPGSSNLEGELAWLAGLAAEAEEARRRLFGLTAAPRPISPGKTLSDEVEGQWPGAETDQQVRDALERLS